MARTSGIEWTDATWNPWMGCAKVSAGCKNCYMFREQKRYGHDPTEIRRSKTKFDEPLKWKEPTVIFVCSWSDFFLETVPELWRNEAWEIIRKCPQHTFLLLTKRPENIPGMLPLNLNDEHVWPYPNVWLGVSAENQEMADLRIPQLLEIPAPVHFISAEPLLGPIDFGKFFFSEPEPSVDWVITGGESDLTNPRPMELAWALDIRDQCQEAGVAFFHKQHGGSAKVDGTWGGRVLDGVIHSGFPQP